MNLKSTYRSGLIAVVIASSFLLLNSLANSPSALARTTPMLTHQVKTPSPIPADADPSLTVIRSQLATQQAQLDALRQDMRRHEDEVDFELRDIRWQVDSRLFVAGAIVIVLGFFGFGTYRQLDATIRDRISTILSKELYRLDPTMLTIRIRRGRDLQREFKRMELSGLRNIEWYSDFSKECARGVTIVPVDDESDEQEFLRFLDAYDLEPSKAAFVLYARERRVPSQVIDAYDNLTVANNPTSLASAVLVVGRGLNT